MSMFGATANAYDDIVAKTTDENLTSENWELILNLCDKVQEEGQEGARNVIAAVLKRLAHRNPNVQLYALSLVEALSKNLGIEVHREIASRAFTQGLEKLITDRNTHEKVRRRALGLIATWTSEFENTTELGVMEDCYNNLKAKNYKFEGPEEAPPPNVDDEIRRKEEEELQRVLEMSMQDKGGRNQWAEYSLASSSGASGSNTNLSKNATASSSAGAATTTGKAPASTSSPSATNSAFAQPKFQAGYVPARTPSPVTAVSSQQNQYRQPQHRQSVPTVSTYHQQPTQNTAVAAPTTNSSATSPTGNQTSPMSGSSNIVTRVRALHTFEPTEPGELAFEKGDVIKVVDRGYKDWWRGQLKGRTGIFPVNYVEAMPEPTAAELAKEAEQEAAVFAQAVNVEKLLNMLRALDPAKDNLADNEEIQELYRSSMALRPKIVKLIDKYSQKRADLVSMNETFVRARTIFDRMMEESLARHTGVYEQQASYRTSQYVRPGSRNNLPRADYGTNPSALGGGAPQSYAWNQGGYEQSAYTAFPAPAVAPYQTVTSPGPTHALGPQPYADPNVANGYTSPGPQVQPVQNRYGAGVPQAQGGYPNVAYGQQPQGPAPYTQGQPQQQTIQPLQPLQAQQSLHAQQPLQTQQSHQTQQPPQAQPAPQVQQVLQAQPQPETHAQVQPQQNFQAQQPQNQPQPAHSYTAQPQNQLHAQPVQSDPQPSPQAQQTHVETHAAQANTPQAAHSQTNLAQSTQTTQQQQQTGPPYVFDPNTTYADPNVQAWAQYYAQGGKAMDGAVYFISIPGLTEAAPVSPKGGQLSQQQGQGQQTTQQLQGQHQDPQLSQQQYHNQQYQNHLQGGQIQPHGGVAANASATSSEDLHAYQNNPNANPQQYSQPQQTSGSEFYGQHVPTSLGRSQSLSQSQLQSQPQGQQSQKQSSPTGSYTYPSSSLTNVSSTGSNPNLTSSSTMSSTPSWVLPKKNVDGAGVRSPSLGAVNPATQGDAATGNSYFGLNGQFAGMQVGSGGGAGGSNNSAEGLL